MPSSQEISELIERTKRLDIALKLLARTSGVFHGLNDKSTGKKHSLTGSRALQNIPFDLIHLAVVRMMACHIGSKKDDATLEWLTKKLRDEETLEYFYKRLSLHINQRSLPDSIEATIQKRSRQSMIRLFNWRENIAASPQFIALRNIRNKNLAHSTLGTTDTARLKFLWQMCRETLTKSEELVSLVLLEQPLYSADYNLYYRSARNLIGHVYRGSTKLKSEERKVAQNMRVNNKIST